MRTSVWLAVVLVLCLFTLTGVPSLHAEDRTTQPPRLITVTGDAEVKIAPDEVILILGVETWNQDIQVAKSQNDERIKKVVALTREYGIEPKHVQTDQINVEPRYRDGYTKADFIGYFVRNTIVITLKDITRFEDLYTAALGAGITHVQGIQFRTTALRQYRDQARALAIKAAQEKASALAGELGEKIGKPHSINENYSGWWSWYSTRWGGAMTQNVVQNVGGGAPIEEGAFAPGQISVSARVTVTFELE